MSSSFLSEAHTDIPLDFDKPILAVPDSHAWPKSDDAPTGDWSEKQRGIPTVDLSDPNVAEVIGRACEQWGAFQVTNHGVPLRLLKDVEAEARRLFCLPTRQKMKALRLPGGSTGYGIPKISNFFSKLMWHEGFTIMGSPVDHARELWPDDYERFCRVMEDHQKKMKKLAKQILVLILDWLKISKEDINWLCDTSCTLALQLNSYPSCPDPKHAMGLAPHTDTSLFTIIYQSHGSGLQLYHDGVGWLTVSPVAGALIVNVGDILHILSNGRFLSVLHRAVVNRTQHRVSMAYFYSLPLTSNVFPLPMLTNSREKHPRYRSIMVKEYFDIKAKHLNDALSLIRT
ncbi:gibberellin 3-beta-dioxygenase 1-like [Malania oleifera]|uniref:gibberellin 3-beta-dioxygenase 1-like n=1 Tax=Malania oleifera TaxID=397392 RepID=UPI0025AE17BE|nr:gibberellin 3-beta-dioxygenase 1-like [Malania oleifera]